MLTTPKTTAFTILPALCVLFVLEGGRPLRGADVAAPGGSIEGTVFYRESGKRAWRLARYYVAHSTRGELAEAVIAIDGRGLECATSRSTVTTIDQKEMRFVPETVAIRAGGRVRFTNSDPQTHNISTADPRHPFSITIGQGREALETFPRAGGVRRPIALGCAFHSQMQGWIYVFNHPFFQVTGSDGRFRLSGIPPGEYRLAVAQAAGDLQASRPIRIKANEAIKIDVVLTPDDRIQNNR